jgi:hypothetical protein
MKISNSIILLVSVAPCTVSADCIITDYSDKFEIVCSGFNPMDPPTVSKKRTNTPHKSNKAKKVSFEASGGETLVNAMSEEELKIMQTRNRQDGFKGKKSRPVKK